MDEEKRNCETCGVQLSLKEDFNSLGDAVLAVKKLVLLHEKCVNCADNSFRDQHNWRKPTKAQRRKLILKYAPKEIQDKLLAQLDAKEGR